MRWLTFVLIMAASGSACTLVDGDRIRATDLARADSRYAALPAGLVIGFSPIPGARRMLGREQLGNLARQYGASTDEINALCFERQTEVLDESRLRLALEQVLETSIRLEIVDFSRRPVPRGEIAFSVSDLPRPPVLDPDAPVLWRGRVRYDAWHTDPVWAQVRLKKLETWLETTTTVPAHKTIERGWVVAKSGWRYPFGKPPVREIDEAVGKQVSRSLPAGQILLPAMLTLPNEVERGDAVEAEILSGGVSLRFAAYAETGGRRDDWVLVSAADSGKRYRARVQEKGKVLIHVDIARNRSEMGVSRAAGARRAAPGGSGRSPEEAAAEGAGVVAGQVSR